MDNYIIVFTFLVVSLLGSVGYIYNLRRVLKLLNRDVDCLMNKISSNKEYMLLLSKERDLLKGEVEAIHSFYHDRSNQIRLKIMSDESPETLLEDSREDDVVSAFARWSQNTLSKLQNHRYGKK